MASVAERGQLILVGGLVLAVALVALAVVLNSAIYTENLATRSQGVVADDAVDFREASRAGAGGVVDEVNAEHAGESFLTLYNQHYTLAMEDWRKLARNHTAVDGVATRVSPASGTEGTRIAQDDRREFTAAGGGDDWTLATNVPRDAGIRGFRLNVSESPLVDGSGLSTAGDYLSSGAFRVAVDDGSTTWYVFVYGDGGATDSVLVRVVEDDGSPALVGEECAASAGVDDHAPVDLAGARVGRGDCDALGFWGDLGGDFAVRYEHALDGGSPTIEGTYEVTVRLPAGSVEGPQYNLDDATSPYAAPAIYAATVEVDYRGNRVAYATAVRVAPGEPDG